VISSAIQKVFRKNRAFQFIIIVLWLVSVVYLSEPIVNEFRFVTLHKIMKAGEITVVTRNTPHCYYIYRDNPMGFEYELAKEFSEYLGVALRVKIAENWDEMIQAVRNGSAAFIAAGMAITAKRQKQVSFSQGYMDIQQHLISNREGSKINKLEELSGQTIHVRKASTYQERLEELQKQGFNFEVQVHNDLPTEELIQRVARGEIELTVADSNIAMLNRRHHPGAIISASINGRQHFGWAMHPKAVKLKQKINSFFKTIRENGKFDEIYDKYYGDTEDVDYVDLATFHRRIKTRLSRYSPFIKAAAKKHGFDWRLIAAQIYQESHLNPWAKSISGAKGLMQLLPGTARSLDIKDVYNPVDNINAGVKHLKNLYDYFDSASGNDRLLIALASYNVGQGHVGDARRLAEKMNLDPNSWESIEKTLPLLSYRKYYKDSRYGYCRGTEPVVYIKQILIYYDILKRQGIEYREADARLSESGAFHSRKF
jgi:membrane-bound lytic murein transglycosylase F